jgi:hypothetical protein
MLFSCVCWKSEPGALLAGNLVSFVTVVNPVLDEFKSPIALSGIEPANIVPQPTTLPRTPKPPIVPATFRCLSVVCSMSTSGRK